ncbi:hypothetical protein Tsubulata_014923 [Turnera subulata]|uniref:Uncharacterized protein n=1 Tax=Turnera subulata TaxID=218843 RepID=A0A9Q0JEW3_9ROSI|nr:hypothetical protein Tsubulata_014923 [Turnera subulata]
MFRVVRCLFCGGGGGTKRRSESPETGIHTARDVIGAYMIQGTDAATFAYNSVAQSGLLDALSFCIIGSVPGFQGRTAMEEKQEKRSMQNAEMKACQQVCLIKKMLGKSEGDQAAIETAGIVCSEACAKMIYLIDQKDFFQLPWKEDKDHRNLKKLLTALNQYFKA